MVLHINLQLQENRAEAAEQRQADEARHAREITAITRQFEQQAEELRGELIASPVEDDAAMGGVEAEAQQGEEDEHEVNVMDEVAEGDFLEEDGGGATLMAISTREILIRRTI